MLRGHSRGVLFLVVASLLWSTDSLFRLSAVMQFDSLFVTFLENLIQMVFLLPWLLYRHSKNIFQLSRQEWLCAAVCGVMGAALALVFYTASFLYVNASLPVLLQKLEPIMVSCISYLVFREKFSRRFFFWSFVALVASILLSFPDFDFGFLDEVSNQRLRGVIYALIACFFLGLCWYCRKESFSQIGSHDCCFLESSIWDYCITYFDVFFSKIFCLYGQLGYSIFFFTNLSCYFPWFDSDDFLLLWIGLYFSKHCWIS
jgi:drug/metabolite transporter (DMT)-like permease